MGIMSCCVGSTFPGKVKEVIKYFVYLKEKGYF